MIGPFARLLDGSQDTLTDFGRRAVDSITIPLRAKSQDLISDVTQGVKASLKVILIKAALAVFALVTALIALGYALSALHAALARSTGPIEATLIMAGVFALLAIVAAIVMLVWPSPSPPPRAALVEVRRDADRVAAEARRYAASAAARPQSAASLAGSPGDGELDFKDSLSAIASALGEAGFRREQAGLQAGLTLAERLRPMQLVSLALLGGFIAGLRLTRRR